MTTIFVLSHSTAAITIDFLNGMTELLRKYHIKQHFILLHSAATKLISMFQ